MKKSVKEIPVHGKRVLLRADFNVPLEGGRITDDTRIGETLPTLRYLQEKGARTIACSHLGRPKGEVVEGLRLDPVAERLSDCLGRPVKKVDEVIGIQAARAVNELENGEILLLENTRFHPGETRNDPNLARELAAFGDLFVNDAFGAAHRAHATTRGVADHLPAVAGLLMIREIQALGKIVASPKRPLVAVFGGAKVSDKIGVVERFLDSLDLDALLVGGGMANTFLRARGFDIGDSAFEAGHIDTAREIMERAGDRISLPVDARVAEKFDSGANRKTVGIDAVPKGWHIMDIGPETVALFEEKTDSAKMVLWNGPLGVSEMEPFSRGTRAMAEILSGLDAETIVGGGDSAAAVQAAGAAEKMTHISTGGGAFLDYLAGRELPGIAALMDA